FQAEDGIRDFHVTGVQTCALPILLQAGGVPTLPAGPHEETLRGALGRLLHTDDSLRIEQYREFAKADVAPDVERMDTRTRRLFHMLAAALTEAISDSPDTLDRKSTRLNSSHVKISYAVFCLKQKRDG